MLNHIHLVGYVGNSPELRLTREDKKVLTFSLATHKTWLQESGVWQKQTEWHRITVFKKTLIPWATENLTRGSLVYVQGELVYSKWEDRFNQPRLTPHILVANSASKILHLKQGKTEEERMAENLTFDDSPSPLQEEEGPLSLPPHASDIPYERNQNNDQ